MLSCCLKRRKKKVKTPAFKEKLMKNNVYQNVQCVIVKTQDLSKKQEAEDFFNMTGKISILAQVFNAVMDRNCFNPNLFIQIFHSLLKCLLWLWIQVKKLKTVQL